jgi:hypothetical protein
MAIDRGDVGNAVVQGVDFRPATDQLADDVGIPHEARHAQRQAGVATTVDELDRSACIEDRLDFLQTACANGFQQLNGSVHK